MALVCCPRATIRDGRDDLLREATSTVVQEDSPNALPVLSLDRNPMEQPASLCIMVEKSWSAGSKLNIGFKGGSKEQKDQVKKYAPEWCRYANIQFNFVDFENLVSEDLDILISFDSAEGSWSYIGKTCVRYARKGEPSMNLDIIGDDLVPREATRGVILHEFGHALAMVHEHQGPNSQVSWNIEQVYKDLCGYPYNWSRERVEMNMFNPYTLEEVRASKYDSKSIMLYRYPASWTKDGEATSFNSDLSDIDKAYASFCYPFEGIYAREHSVTNTPSQGQLRQDDGKFIYFQRRYDAKPDLPVGITSLDIGKGADIRIRAVANEATTEGFRASLQTWGDTILYAASMTYLEKSSLFQYLQTGAYDTMETHPGGKPPLKRSTRIDFGRPFQSPPMVVTWLKSLHMDAGKDWCVKVYPSKIDEYGFTIHIDSRSDSVLYSAGVTWLACPVGHPGVASGKFNIMSAKPRRKKRQRRPRSTPRGNSGVFDYPTPFHKPPKIIAALDHLDFDHSEGLCLRLSTSSTKTGVSWKLENGPDSIMRGSGASFFAWI